MNIRCVGCRLTTTGCSVRTEKLICMANDIIEEVLDLDMEPKPESFWWTSTQKHEDMRTFSVGSKDKVWDLPLCEVFDAPSYRFHRGEKGLQGAERSMCKPLRSWWRHKYIYRSKTVPMKTKCKTHPRSCVQHSTEWQYQLAVEWSHDQRGACVGRPYFAAHLETSHEAGRNLGGLQNKNIAVHEGLLEEGGPAAADGENCEQILDNNDVGRL